MKSNGSKFVIAKAVMFTAIILLSGFFLYMYTIARVDHSEQKIITDYQEITFDRIWSELKILREQSYDSAESVAKSIEEDLYDMDLNKIREELSKNEISDSLYNTFVNNIKGVSLNGVDNYRNGITIMTQSGIIVDFNYDRAESKKTRTWEEEINSAWNKELEENAIEGILTHDTKSILAMEKYNELNTKHIKLSSITKESLKLVYDAEGIDGLKNYQFKAAAYITDNGDIFGKEDIYRGIRQKNHKIMVVQEFNLYDQLMTLSDDLLDSDKYVNDIEIDYAITTNIIYIMGMFYIVSIILMLLYFSQIYNNYYIGLSIRQMDIDSDSYVEEDQNENISNDET